MTPSPQLPGSRPGPAKAGRSRSRWSLPASVLVGAVLVAVSACNEQKAAAPVPLPPPEVSVVSVRPQPIPYVRDLPGRVAPMRIAEVRSRVSGLVIRRLFEQGSHVNEGDVLYKIDPAPYQVDLASAEATLANREAALVLANQQADRLETLLARRRRPRWPAPRRLATGRG